MSLTFGVTAGAQHTLVAEVSKRICFYVLADLFHRMAGGNQLSLGGSVYAIKTGRDGWRATDPHMNLGRTCSPHHLDNLTAGCSADKRIVHQYHALAPHKSATGFSLILTPKCRIDCLGSIKVRPT